MLGVKEGEKKMGGKEDEEKSWRFWGRPTQMSPRWLWIVYEVPPSPDQDPVGPAASTSRSILDLSRLFARLRFHCKPASSSK